MSAEQELGGGWVGRTERHGSGAAWEAAVGYSRVVRTGDHVAVAGTTSPGATPYEQARGALRTIVEALAKVGARPEHVVRTRMFVTDIAMFDEVGRAHGEVFADVRPVATMVAVSALADPALWVEIEADAIVSGD